MSGGFCPACRSPVEGSEAECPTCAATRPRSGWPADGFVGRVLDGKYRIERVLASGGFATVFVATQLHGSMELGTVVVKRLHPELASEPSVARRFLTEAKAARELTSPHVVRVFDLGVADGIPFMVQELIAGHGLERVMFSAGRMSAARCVRIGMQVAEAMAEAHAKGILHRDLKPENLHVQQTAQGDFVKVLDFGIARIDRGGSMATNSLIGTPRYMAPEQIRQRDVDGRADVYALGVILFEMLAGRPPIDAETEVDYVVQNLSAEPLDLGGLRPDVPAPLRDLIMQMLAKSKEDRPTGMAEVLRRLREVAPSLPEAPVTAEDPRFVAATAVTHVATPPTRDGMPAVLTDAPTSPTPLPGPVPRPPMVAAGESFATPPPAVTPAPLRRRASSRPLVVIAVVAVVLAAAGMIGIGVLSRPDDAAPGATAAPPGAPDPVSPVPVAPRVVQAEVAAPRPAGPAADVSASSARATDAGVASADGGAARASAAKRGKRPGLLRGKSGAVVDTEYEEGP